MLVPGGPGQTALMEDGPVHEWLRAAHETSEWTTSVCTGSLILAAAGLLEGKRATSNWQALEELGKFDVEVVPERVVFDGKLATVRRGDGGDRHGAGARGEDRKRPGRAGDPAGDRVRPAAAVRRGLAGDGAGGDRRGWCARIRASPPERSALT